MLQSYSAIAPCICILSHSSLFNLALTLHCATGAYLRHAVVGGTPQLRKCRVVTIRHAISWLSVWRTILPQTSTATHPGRSAPSAADCAAPAPPPEAETMTGGEHFRHPGGGGSCAKPRISPRGVVATCGACQIARPQSHPGGGAGLCSRRGFTCITLCVNGVKHSRVVQ